MSTFNLTQVPTTLSMQLSANTAVFQSPLLGSVQILDRGGMKWLVDYTFSNISGAKRRELMGLVASLRGQANRLRVPVYDNPKGGAYGGVPLVDGASQTGSILSIKGCSNNITNWIRAGDYFSVVVNGEHELKICTQDNSSDGTGLIATLEFEPRLRASPLDSAVIFVEDGVLQKPEGIFYMSGSDVSWTSRPFQTASELSSMSLNMIEDVFATQ